MDVVSHHANIVAGFAAQRLAAEEAQDSDTAAYWNREIDVAHRMKAQAKRALAAMAQPAPSPADERAAWQTGAPPVKEGSYAGFIVACRRKHNGEVYVFEANYANQYAEELRDDDGEEFTAHGWYDVAQDIHGEYSSVFSKTCGEGDEIIGWQPLPKWIEESARAASANETGAEGVRAWETDDGRVISDEQKQKALRDGGASASSVRPYAHALGRIAPAQAPEPVSTPAGWKLVPVAPTPEMCCAMEEAIDAGWKDSVVWARGIAAAPQPLAPASAPVGLTEQAITDAVKKWFPDRAYQAPFFARELLEGAKQ
ncbi:hypothetical protein C6P79_14715 [Burkholderia multivorans]|nr:hypothetical protein C6P79_14715 [Burkholderia multivorans]